MFTTLEFLAKLKGLRGGAFDIFGKTEERKMECPLITDCAHIVDEPLPTLASDNVGPAAETAAVPEYIRGYGHLTEAHPHNAKAREAELLARWRAPKSVAAAA